MTPATGNESRPACPGDTPAGPLLCTVDDDRLPALRQRFADRAPHYAFVTPGQAYDAGAVRVAVCRMPSAALFAAHPQLDTVFVMTAGIDQIDLRQIPAHVRLVRMVEPQIQAMMREYVTMAVLALHRGLIGYVAQQRRAVWAAAAGRPAAQCRVGLLGLGTLAQAVADALRPFGFALSGWSRTRKALDGIACHAGPDELAAMARHTDILVCLLPLTDDTRGILGRELLGGLPRGACLVNAGRGAHLDEAALLDLLDEGRLDAAVLDVCGQEPPDAAHPFWTHPRIFLTPHVATRTGAEGAADAIIENLGRRERGEAMVGVVDPQRGY